MATFTTIKNRGGGRGALAGVLQYIRQGRKNAVGRTSAGVRLELYCPDGVAGDTAHQGAVR